MLYVVPTPIGNLQDITQRAKTSLESCDFILCEDTKVTKNLLFHLEISKKLVSFHKFNEKKMEESVLEDLQNGKEVCLVSDAGTPGINDPGASLIGACHRNNIKVTALPGASSVITALTLSGLEYKKFQFLGFFPRNTKERNEWIEDMLEYDGVSIFFESPKRSIKTISILLEKTIVYAAKELSKIHEAFFLIDKTNLHEYEDRLKKGELCILIKGEKKEACTLEKEDAFIMEILCEHHSNRDAAKIASKLTGKKKQCFYSL